MIPKLILFEADPAIKLLDVMLHQSDYRDSFLEKTLNRMVDTLRHRDEAMLMFDRFLEQVGQEEFRLGELICIYMGKIGVNLYYQMLDCGVYLPSGKMPYKYHSRHEYDYFVLEFDEWSLYD